MAEHADHVETVSNAARKYMLEVDKIKRDDIEVVYLGFDFDKLSPNIKERTRVRSELAFVDDDFVIGYIGNFAVGKGHAELLRAFVDIRKEIPNAKLLFAGVGNMPDEVRDLLSEAGSAGITFAGWRDDIAAIYNAMDLFVQPSLSEAFSQVLIEAMGVGLPVVATDVGGAREVIENGVNGVLIGPSDHIAISEAVIRLYRDRHVREALAQNGMQSVRSRYTVDIMVEKQMALYKRWFRMRSPGEKAKQESY
jgi:glycosyltransferase involved in cell wall biosynthesis